MYLLLLQVSTSGTPFAAFGVSVDGNWGGASAHEYEIISLNGPQFTGTTQVHVFDETTQTAVAGTWGLTLNQVLSLANPYNGVPYGDLQVMRAYAYIGDTGSPSYGSVDINSITVSSVPLPGALLLFGSGLVGLAAIRRRFKK
jgi:hypothetical protein